MTELLMVLSFAVVCAGCDWLRGRDSKETKVPAFVSKALYGAVVGTFIMLVSGPDDRWTVFLALFSALWAAGASPGWGHPHAWAFDAGNKRTVEPERWQFHRVLVDSAPLALLFRGAMWAAPTIPLAYFHIEVLYALPSMALAMAIAPYITRQYFSGTSMYESNELIRGALLGLLLGGSLLGRMVML